MMGYVRIRVGTERFDTQAMTVLLKIEFGIALHDGSSFGTAAELSSPMSNVRGDTLLLVYDLP